MKYGDFCLELQSHIAALQKFLNELKCPSDHPEPELFERSKESAVEACMRFEHDLTDEFGEHFDD